MQCVPLDAQLICGSVTSEHVAILTVLFVTSANRVSVNNVLVRMVNNFKMLASTLRITFTLS